MTQWTLLLLSIFLPLVLIAESPSVFLAILVRNKAHTLPTYLQCLENLDYDKKKISVYINTNNNTDETDEILKKWSEQHASDYAALELESHHIADLEGDQPHNWNPTRFKALALIRNKSLEKALANGADFYFVVDCDNFIAPETLSTLVAKNKPIIAPLLKAIPEPGDIYSNFFGAVSSTGYYESHPQYMKILGEKQRGTFQVPVVHCTYLIRRDAIPQLSYIDGSADYEFVIFSREARKHHIPQYICNEKPFGSLLHFQNSPTLSEEKTRFEEILASDLNLLDPKPTVKQVFSHIYTNKIWGENENGEGFSGPGSTLVQTVKYRKFLQKFLADHQIKSVVDAGCGCWTFSKTIDWTGIDYKGFDVVESVIKKNTTLYGSSHIQFAVGDGTKANALPPADLLICKEVLQHLPFEDIENFLSNLNSYKYCLITNDINPYETITKNNDIERGGWRYLDLKEPPFNLEAQEILTYPAPPFLKQVLLITPPIKRIQP